MAGTKRGTRALAAAALVGLTAAGCARTQAEVRTAPEMPALEVPAPPPRIVEPIVSAPSASQPGLQGDVPAAASGDARPDAPPAGRSADSPVGPVQTPTAPGAGTRPLEPSTPPTATQQTSPTAREIQLAGVIRARLARAAANLNRVDYRTLSADARATYDQAKRFISQAEDALKANNLVFAETVADKAVTLAAQLAGR